MDTLKKGKPPEEKIIAALEQCHGSVRHAAAKLKVSRQTLYNWINDSETLTEALHNSRESLKDLAEYKLAELIKKGDLGAICFFLKTQAKDRGYVEKIEQTTTHTKTLDSKQFGRLKRDILRSINRPEK